MYFFYVLPILSTSNNIGNDEGRAYYFLSWVVLISSFRSNNPAWISAMQKSFKYSSHAGLKATTTVGESGYLLVLMWMADRFVLPKYR